MAWTLDRVTLTASATPALLEIDFVWLAADEARPAAVRSGPLPGMASPPGEPDATRDKGEPEYDRHGVHGGRRRPFPERTK